METIKKYIKHIDKEWQIITKKDNLYVAKKLDGQINDVPVGLCTIKIINMDEFDLNEIIILLRLNENRKKNEFLKKVTLQFYGYGKDDNGKFYIYMEHFENSVSISSLLNQISNNKFNNDTTDEIGFKILSTLIQLHKLKIIHCNLNCGNVLLIYDNQGTIVDLKFINFGETTTQFQKFQKNNYSFDKWMSIGIFAEMLGVDSNNRDINGVPLLPSSIIGSSTFNLLKGYFMDQIDVNEILVNRTPFSKDKIISIGKELQPKLLSTSTLLLFNKSLTTTNAIPDTVTNLTLSSFNRQFTKGSISNTVTNLSLPSYNLPINPKSIPNNVSTLSLQSFNHQLLPNVIPRSVTDLSLASFNHKLNKDSFPTRLIELTLDSYNYPLNPLTIPNKVTNLSLQSFNHPLVNDSIPSSVVYLSLQSFNRMLTTESIPESVRYLTLSSFNQIINEHEIPSNVRYLELNSFNQPIVPFSIPNSLTNLSLQSFNHQLNPGSIPNSVKDLTIKLTSYNHPIVPFSIPICVTVLVLPSFNHPIVPSTLPIRVTHLTLASFNYPLLVGSLPNSVIELTLDSFNQLIYPNTLPNNIKNLTLPSFNHPLMVGSIPNSVVNLSLSSYNHPIILPNGITNLSLSSYNLPLTPKSIPTSVVKLSLSSYNHPLTPDSIPFYVYDLKLQSYNHPIAPLSLSNILTNLTLQSFNHPFQPLSLPKTVSYLEFGECFDIESFGFSLPQNSILTLKSGFNFTKPINEKYIPKSVTNLQLENYNINLESYSIPTTVKSLTLGSNFNSFESLINLSKSIVYLKIGKTNFTDKIDSNRLPLRIIKSKSYTTLNTQINITPTIVTPVSPPLPPTITTTSIANVQNCKETYEMLVKELPDLKVNDFIIQDKIYKNSLVTSTSPISFSCYSVDNDKASINTN